MGAGASRCLCDTMMLWFSFFIANEVKIEPRGSAASKGMEKTLEVPFLEITNFLFGTAVLIYQSMTNGVVGGALGWSASLKYQKQFSIFHYFIPDISETDF